MLRASGTILAKDLRLRLRDRSVLLFAVVVPLGLTALFSVILPTGDDLTVVGVVVDEDHSDTSTAFATQLLPELEAAGLVTPPDEAPDDLDAVRQALEDGSLDAAWYFPAGFEEQLRDSGSAQLEVLVNPDRPLRAEVARGIAGAYASQLDRVVLAVATVAAAGQEVGPADLEQVVDAVLETEVASVVPLETARRQLDGTSYLAAGMAAFFVFFTVQFGVNGLLEERQLGTLPRLLAAPMHPGAVQVGKAAGAFVVGVASMAVLAGASAALLGARWGPPAGVVILVVSMVLAALGLMALVGTFAKTAEQAGNLQSIVAVVLGMLGGVFFPLSLGEGIGRYLTRVAPHGWFLRGLGDQVGTGDWWAVLPSTGAILLFGLVAGGIATVRLRKAIRW